VAFATTLLWSLTSTGIGAEALDLALDLDLVLVDRRGHRGGDRGGDVGVRYGAEELTVAAGARRDRKLRALDAIGELSRFGEDLRLSLLDGLLLFAEHRERAAARLLREFLGSKKLRA